MNERTTDTFLDSPQTLCKSYKAMLCRFCHKGLRKPLARVCGTKLIPYPLHYTDQATCDLLASSNGKSESGRFVPFKVSPIRINITVHVVSDKLDEVNRITSVIASDRKVYQPCE